MQSSSSPFARPFIESHCFFLPVGRLCKPCSPSLLSLVLVPFLREKKQNSHAHANKTLNSAKYMTHLIQALKLHTAPQNKRFCSHRNANWLTFALFLCLLLLVFLSLLLFFFLLFRLAALRLARGLSLHRRLGFRWSTTSSCRAAVA